jgi:hypothetical protein
MFTHLSEKFNEVREVWACPNETILTQPPEKSRWAFAREVKVGLTASSARAPHYYTNPPPYSMISEFNIIMP